MKFNYIVMSCTKQNGSVLEFPIIFPMAMNGFEIQEALQKSNEVFEVYESNKLVSYGIVNIGPNGVTCHGHSDKMIDMFKDFVSDNPEENIVEIIKSRGDIDRKLIESFN